MGHVAPTAHPLVISLIGFWRHAETHIGPVGSTGSLMDQLIRSRFPPRIGDQSLEGVGGWVGATAEHCERARVVLPPDPTRELVRFDSWLGDAGG